MNKREFVQASGSALMSLGGWAVAPGVSAARSASDGGLTDWQARLGERFALYGTPQPANLVLQRVVSRTMDARTQQFSLVFLVEGPAPSGGTQILRPAVGGALVLHLVEAGTDGAGAALRRADICQLA